MATHAEASISLEAGDHLTRDEFHRRYLANPRIKKAELIEGVVYVPAPVRVRRHGRPHSYMMAWLGNYVSVTPDIIMADNSTVFLDDLAEVQPDAFLWRPERGAAQLRDDDYFEGAPHLVVEIAASSVSYDLHVKKEAYRRNGVREYVVWRVLDEAIDWFRLRDGQYVLVKPDDNGIVESEQSPGLRLHLQSLLAGGLAAVLGHLRATRQ
jgi:Uma2 family endonuclease